MSELSLTKKGRHRRPLRICRARLHFAKHRLGAGAGRRSGSGWRQGRVRWGRPLLSRPRGVVGSGPAAVLVQLLSRPRFWLSRGRTGVSLGLDGCEVRLCPPCVRVCACVVACPVCVPAPPGVFLPATENPKRFSSRGSTRLCDYADASIASIVASNREAGVCASGCR